MGPLLTGTLNPCGLSDSLSVFLSVCLSVSLSICLLFLSLSLSLSLSLCLPSSFYVRMCVYVYMRRGYKHTHMYICIYVYMYIYIHIHTYAKTEQEREGERERELSVYNQDFRCWVYRRGPCQSFFHSTFVDGFGNLWGCPFRGCKREEALLSAGPGVMMDDLVDIRQGLNSPDFEQRGCQAQASEPTMPSMGGSISHPKSSPWDDCRRTLRKANMEPEQDRSGPGQFEKDSSPYRAP